MSKKASLEDVGPLFHSILFAYQKALRENLGETATQALTKLAIPYLRETTGKTSPELLTVGSLDDTLNRFIEWLNDSAVVKKAMIERINDKHILEIAECQYASHIHHMLRPKDVTCPWAIMAKVLAQNASGKRVNMNLSEFTPTGSKTIIDFSEDQ